MNIHPSVLFIDSHIPSNLFSFRIFEYQSIKLESKILISSIKKIFSSTYPHSKQFPLLTETIIITNFSDGNENHL
jgi:hypothetical protein